VAAGFVSGSAAKARLRVRLTGLGATGVAIAASLAADPGCELVEAVDSSARLRGRALSELVAGYAGNVVVHSDIDSSITADVAIVCTSSRLAEVVPVIESLLEAGCHVLTISEEMGFPAWTDSAATRRLDKAAVARGLSVLGTGCNPGMIMDTLPAVISGLLLEVRRIEITRSADMSRYGRILAKFGLGLRPPIFDGEVRSGRVVGHIGFAQSISSLASTLGWRLDRIEVDPVTRARVADAPRTGEHLKIQPGTVSIVRHCARGLVAGQVRIDIRACFGVFAPGDDLPRGNTLTLVGAEQTLRIVVPDGFESFLSTVAMAANCAQVMPYLQPGVRTMADLTIGQIASKGFRLAG
jgi:2,4-diaminopentanoate dehydrogenase